MEQVLARKWNKRNMRENWVTTRKRAWLRPDNPYDSKNPYLGGGPEMWSGRVEVSCHSSCEWQLDWRAAGN